MTKCEKALYSLNSVGCSPFKLHPHAIGFVYKQFCQSILKFGFEFVFLRGIPSLIILMFVRIYFLRTSMASGIELDSNPPDSNEMKVEPIGLAYGKHKVFGWKQCVKNQLKDKIFKFNFS